MSDFSSHDNNHSSVAASTTRQDQGEGGFRLLFINNPQPMWVYDLETLAFLEVNQAAIAHYGYTRNEFLRMRITDIRPHDDVPRLLQDVKNHQVGLQYSGRWRHRLKAGTLIDVEVTSHTLTFNGRDAELVVIHDVTQQKSAEDDLLRAEEKYRTLVERVPAVSYIAEPGEAGRWVFVSPQIESLLDFSPEEWAARPGLWYERLEVQDRNRVMEAERAARNPGDRFRLEYRLRTRAGRRIWVSDEATLFLEPSTNQLLMRGILVDITERKEAEQALRIAEERYRSLFEQAIVGMFQSTPQGLLLNVNAAMARMYGYESPQEMVSGITDISNQLYVDPSRRVDFKRTMEERGIVQNFECQVYRKDKSKMWVSANASAIRNEGGAIVRYEGTFEDITQRKMLEDQLRQAQKMEAVGRLAGGVAHDFNNAIGVIVGYSTLLKERLTTDQTAQRYADEIGKAGHRAASLTRQLLIFSRKQVIQPAVLDLNSVITETESMLRRLIGEHIQITTVRGDKLGRVKADPGQMDQVLMNLAVNARDAMPQSGRLIIETANAELDATSISKDISVTPGRYVMLSVTDTGCGMDKETQARIFEPFFTTKEPGKGTGLGLSTVYGIVKQSGGHIWVYSEPGKGTRFKIYLPQIEDHATVPLVADESVVPGGSETVLLVEDEEPMRALTRLCLTTAGYTVLDAPNGEAAIQTVSRHEGPIHLLLTDVVMPGVSGRLLAENLRLLRPEMRLLYMSGYTADLIADHGVLQSNEALIEKPFTREALLRKVRTVLDEERRSEAAGC